MHALNFEIVSSFAVVKPFRDRPTLCNLYEPFERISFSKKTVYSLEIPVRLIHFNTTRDKSYN